MDVAVATAVVGWLPGFGSWREEADKEHVLTLSPNSPQSEFWGKKGPARRHGRQDRGWAGSTRDQAIQSSSRAGRALGAHVVPLLGHTPALPPHPHKGGRRPGLWAHLTDAETEGGQCQGQQAAHLSSGPPAASHPLLKAACFLCGEARVHASPWTRRACGRTPTSFPSLLTKCLCCPVPCASAKKTKTKQG